MSEIYHNARGNAIKGSMRNRSDMGVPRKSTLVCLNGLVALWNHNLPLERDFTSNIFKSTCWLSSFPTSSVILLGL